MILAKLLILLSLAVTGGRAGLGTVFGSSRWDRSNPNSHLACTHKDIDDRAMVVAHNTYPCNTRVWIMNPRTGRSTVATVLDRGPRHALIDMSKAVAKQLHHNGMERVLVVPLPGPASQERIAARGPWDDALAMLLAIPPRHR